MNSDPSCIVLSEFCRCCFVEESDMVYVFDILDEFDSKLCDLIGDCGGISISIEDAYSKHICGNCLNDFANAARFRRRCQRTQQFFQEATNQSIIPKKEHTDIQKFVQIEEVALVEQTVDFQHESGDSETVIKYIIADSVDDPELQSFDYDNLISSQNSQFEEVETQQFSNDSDSFIEFDLHSEKKVVRQSLRPDTMKLNFICQQCGAGFTLQKNLAKHTMTHEKFICDVCLTVFDRKELLEIHKLIHSASSDLSGQTEMHFAETPTAGNAENRCKSKKYTCSYCQRTFASNSALTSHVRVHTQERPYPCSYCGKRFRTVGGQELHERRHSGVKPYRCDICGRAFTESSNLKVHRRTHTKEKPHVCTICNRAFARVFLLKIHQRIHTGERPFSCPECGKSFRQQGDLSAHRRIHSGDRPFKCEICNKGFIKSSSYTQHKRKHHKQMQNFASVAVLENVEDLIEYEYGIEVEPGDRNESIIPTIDSVDN